MPDRDREDEEEDEEEEETTDPKKPTTDEVRTTGGERGVCWVAAFVLLICSHRA
jgi:hypothetical protein